MIRDLHSAPPRAPITHLDALAFARGQIEQEQRHDSTGREHDGSRAFTIAVTAPRMVTCKRGVAANLAAHLATLVREDGMSVCVADMDLESRDIGARFGVDRPVVMDVASLPRDSTSEDVTRVITHLAPIGLSVLPTRRPGDVMVPLLHTKSAALMPALRESFDFLVIDAPIAAGAGPDQWERELLGQVDALIVAVSAEPAAAGGMLRYLSTLSASRARGGIARTFDTHVVLTGSEEDRSSAWKFMRELDRSMKSISVVAHIPQLWGRHLPDFALGADFDPELRTQFSALIDTVTRVAPGPR
jgi:MinD-like ATPase involved in chromosome partitioning or flagellar assembly